MRTKTQPKTNWLCKNCLHDCIQLWWSA